MHTLLHICCAPCSIACISSLRAEGIEPVGFWYNPNIHPYTEYRQRRNTLVEYAADIHMPLIQEGSYGLRQFIARVDGDFAGRCQVCYRLRMQRTAAYAAGHGFTHFTSTLFISPYQQHELLREEAERAAADWGVELLYRDFRPLFRQGQDRARELGMYMQKYCGCIFSEEERYQKRKKKKSPQGSAV